MIYYAHTSGKDKSEWQTVLAHLTGTADIAHHIGADTGLVEFADAAAMLHDLGKYSHEFQRRLEGAKGRVDHLSAGTQVAIKVFQQPFNGLYGRILAYCISGHHGGLLDAGSPADTPEEKTLAARIKAKPPDYSAWSQEVDASSLKLPPSLPIRPIHLKHVGFSLAFMTRMIYSILVDADFLDTESVMSKGKPARGQYEDIPSLADRYAGFLQKFNNPEGEVNRRRTQTLHDCIAGAEQKPGLFTLTLPTGAGKTYASMAFALAHAKKHGLKRIIYVIPYTSIIEQNAGVFKDCLGDDSILEHHSNLDWDKLDQEDRVQVGKNGSLREKLKLASENWDIPIIVTTSVQFFESLYANRSSRSRKVHNLAKSVMIFDEAQMLPRDYLKPCIFSIVELVRNYGASAVFCTATQPHLTPFIPPGNNLRELIPDPKAEFNFYRRVQVKQLGRQTDAEILQKINSHDQALCIVNTRKHAKSLFDGLEEPGRYHLSTLMCAVHRKQVIQEIRDRLDAKLPCRVISTQLLEAGVDLDFPVGYRAIAGLDSIIQSAGRVNRNKKVPSANLFVFEPDSEFARKMPTALCQTAAVARIILDHYQDADPICMEAVEAYYKELYAVNDDSAFDRKKILDCFEASPLKAIFDFRKAAENFKLIEEETVGIIVPYDDTARQYIADLQTTAFPFSVVRRLQPYTVNIYKPEFDALLGMGMLDEVAENFIVLNERGKYLETTGLVLPERQGGIAIFD